MMVIRRDGEQILLIAYAGRGEEPISFWRHRGSARVFGAERLPAWAKQVSQEDSEADAAMHLLRLRTHQKGYVRGRL